MRSEDIQIILNMMIHDLTRSNIEVAFNNASPELRKYLTNCLSKYSNPIDVLSNI